MRPPDLPGGNNHGRGPGRPVPQGFNEAAGFTRRKPGSARRRVRHAGACFNEAAGFTRRKRPATVTVTRWTVACFNEAAGFTRRKLYGYWYAWRGGRYASMRPPDLPGGNTFIASAFSQTGNVSFNEAAGFTRRKRGTAPTPTGLSTTRFNEAAGFTRRKLRNPERSKRQDHASMRPPDLPGGNPTPEPAPGVTIGACFNEAAGFTRRKLDHARETGASLSV